MSMEHPLPVGTIIKVNKEHNDVGVMSWDDEEVEIERVAAAGSTCVVTTVEGDAPRYHVEFLPSEVWNVLEPDDFKNPGDYEIVELGTGEVPRFYKEYYDNPDRERDPEAVRKIAEELGQDGPGM